MKLRYLGQCGFLIDTGDIKIVTDPHLSDLLGRFATEEMPWRRLYPPPCALIDLKPDLVLISHDHGDHMDPITLGEYRAAGGDCAIAAAEPVCGRLVDMGFSNIIKARAERKFEIGGVVITPIPCAHTELHTVEGMFRELSYLIEVGGKTLFFGGDMSLYDGLFERLAREKIDYMMIPANGRDEYRTSRHIIGNTNCREAARLAADLGAGFIPTHHDLYECNGCPADEIALAAEEAGARLIVIAPGAEIEI